jgi:hypothetical protein
VFPLPRNVYELILFSRVWGTVVEDTFPHGARTIWVAGCGVAAEVESEDAGTHYASATAKLRNTGQIWKDRLNKLAQTGSKEGADL